MFCLHSLRICSGVAHRRHTRILLLCLFLILTACTTPSASNAPGNDLPQTLTLNLGRDPETLDPAYATDHATLDVVGLLFDGLTRYDPQEAAVRPALAEEWDVSADGRTYTFKLREDAYWVNSEGEIQREVLADDVVFAIQRACTAESYAPTAYLLDVIVGCRAHRQPLEPPTEPVAVQALTATIVEFTLVEPNAAFPVLMSLAIARPLPREVVEANPGAWATPEEVYSNGPFVLSEWQRADHLSLQRNPNYYDPAALTLSEITAVVMDETAALAAYQANNLDLTPLDPTQWQQVQNEATAVLEPCTYSYGFTMIKPPLDNVRVRRALTTAIDRQRIVQEVLGQGQVAARTFTPPGVVSGPNPGEGGVDYSPDLAKSHLAEAGYPNGEGMPPLTMLVPDDPTQVEIAETVQGMWQEMLGISVTVTTLPITDYQAMLESPRPLEEMPHIWALGWCTELPDASAWSEAAFGVRRPATLPTLGNAEYDARLTLRNPAAVARRTSTTFDDLTQQANGTDDPDERRALFTQAEQVLLNEEAVVAPLYQYTYTVLTKPYVQRTFFAYAEQPLYRWQIDMAVKAGE